MGYNLPVRLVKLRKKQVDIIRELKKRHIKVAESEFSRFINGIESTPKSELVLSEADKIVTEWEQEA